MSTGPAYCAWSVWIGNTITRRVQLTDSAGAIDLTSSLLVLTITWPGGALTLRSDDSPASVVKLDQTDPLTKGWFAITLTPAQTRLLPIGGGIRYELERRWSGTERSYITGDIIAQTENNTDG